jgi:hypothetical protein
LITERPPGTALPAELAAQAEAVKRDLVAHHEARAGDVQLQYLGAYRQVIVEEICIRPRPGVDRHYTLSSTLAADEALTSLRPAPFAFNHGGSSLLYGEPAPPQWIDASPGRQGKAQLWKLYAEPSEFDADTRARFDAAVLSAARRMLAGEAGPRLSALAIEQDTAPLPADRESQVPVIFYVNAVEGGRQQVTARAWIDPLRAFGGEARTAFELTAPCNDGRECRFTARFTLHAPPIPADAKGDAELPLSIDWAIRGPRAAGLRSGTVRATAHVFVDGPRLALVSVQGGVEQVNFAGLAQYSAFEAHLGFMNED